MTRANGLIRTRIITPKPERPIVGLDRSHHYFHSGYIDLILSGLVGIRPRGDDVLEVDPLLPGGEALRWFRVQDVPYHGHLVSVTWDADGRHFGARGLAVEVDGRIVARRSPSERVLIPITRVAAAPIARPIDRAVQLVRGADGVPASGDDASGMAGPSGPSRRCARQRHHARPMAGGRGGQSSGAPRPARRRRDKAGRAEAVLAYSTNGSTCLMRPRRKASAT